MTCTAKKCRKAGGATCKSTSECGSRLPCTGGVCRLAGLDEKCTNRRDCGNLGAYCSKMDGVCKLTAFRGEQCAEDGACPGMKCMDGKCQAQSLGSSCKEEGAECPGFLICAGGQCVYRQQEGEACSATIECEKGTCYQGLCRTRLSSSKGCTNDIDCEHGKFCSARGNCCSLNEDNC